MFRRFVQHISKLSQTYPKRSQKVPTALPNISETNQKITESHPTMSEQISETVSQTCPKTVQHVKKHGKTVSVGPGIEPGTLRIRLPDRSEDQPNPVTRKGVSRNFRWIKIREKVPRKNLVAEKDLFTEKQYLRFTEKLLFFTENNIFFLQTTSSAFYRKQ